MAVCIPENLLDEVKDIVTRNKTSIDRVNELNRILNDEAAASSINKMFEESLLLKNQEKAINKFIDKDAGFNSTLLNKLQGIYEDLKWSFPSLNAYVNKFFSF
jgi:hypothetical protein